VTSPHKVSELLAFRQIEPQRPRWNQAILRKFFSAVFVAPGATGAPRLLRGSLADDRTLLGHSHLLKCHLNAGFPFAARFFEGICRRNAGRLFERRPVTVLTSGRSQNFPCENLDRFSGQIDDPTVNDPSAEEGM